ncbi:hypothetical protein OIE13_30590 [Streptosporangium sp. NBC_01810]|uniref:hypothetical protein n=1 Tax=Streptosporangium sp. NBC_01810 TaxID=2975951 RepID=UPI002DDAEC2B|nr:hypothetical protein [Streptosporangium sp. NBC_01810]WSA25233.1 hypothetical protein OIE13_30590 [Streptosporangium sp. NBC_01810]
MPGTTPRAALIKGLVDLATFLEANPTVPVPSFAGLTYFARGTDLDIRSEVDTIAALLDTEADPGDSEHDHYRACRTFGPVEYKAVGIFSAARARHRANTSYEGCITPDPVPSPRTA